MVTNVNTVLNTIRMAFEDGRTGDAEMSIMLRYKYDKDGEPPEYLHYLKSYATSFNVKFREHYKAIELILETVGESDED